MEMLMLSMIGTLLLLIAEITEVIRSWHVQRKAARPPAISDGSRVAPSQVTLKKAA